MALYNNMKLEPLIKIETLRKSKVDEEYALEAVHNRCNEKDWYVLKYDVVTTEYNNTIVFKTLAEAYTEFLKTESSYPEERIELMFAPQMGDEEFDDNIVINYKLYKGGMRLTELEQKMLNELNEILDSDCEWDGPLGVIKNLYYNGFTKENLLEMDFDEGDIDSVIKEIESEEKEE